MVTHYSKLAPLKALTHDFKQAVLRHQRAIGPGSSSEKPGKKKKVKHSIDESAAIDKILSVVNEQALEYQKQVDDLHALISKVKTQRLRRFVVNRKTKVAHRILAGFEDIGPAAITHCGWKYARSQVSITDEEPTKAEEACDTCMPALRALLALY